MARGCGPCNHPEADEINKELLKPDGLSYQGICDKYGIRSKSSLSTHKNNHLPKIIAADAVGAGIYEEFANGFSSESVYSDVVKLRDAVMKSIKRAEETGNDRDLREAVKASVPLLNLAARLAGLVEDRMRITMDVSESEDFKFLMMIILRELDNYPDAKDAVLKALEVADTYNTKTVTLNNPSITTKTWAIEAGTKEFDWDVIADE